MILTLTLRSLLSRPGRSAVLASGFGLGVGVMAALLGIGGVILEQARAPVLIGGGDVLIGGTSGRVPSPKFVLSGILQSGPLAPQVAVAAPSTRANLYLVRGGVVTPIRARGTIPSLERALGDPETRSVAGWTDTAADRAWTTPDPDAVLREIDRFHPVPDVPARADSWAEWLYFNGRAGTTRFYLTFLAGPLLASGRRTLGVRLQLDRDGHLTSYADAATVEEAALIASAPDLTSGGNKVRLIGHDYHLAIDLPGESGSSRVQGDLVVHALPGRSMPPLAIRGAGGWVSGYVVPVMSAGLDGTLHVGGNTLNLAGGTAYHDHNWGFWKGVRWQWGQVQGGGLSFVYGRVYPPTDAADPSRIPGFLVVLGAGGPVAYATQVSIEETNDAATGRPTRIVVRGQSESLALTLDLATEQTTVTRMQRGSLESGIDFLQLRAAYRVTGRAGDRAIAFTAPGSAETFRGR